MSLLKETKERIRREKVEGEGKVIYYFLKPEIENSTPLEFNFFPPLSFLVLMRKAKIFNARQKLHFRLETKQEKIKFGFFHKLFI